jgi:hypothetical protein
MSEAMLAAIAVAVVDTAAVDTIIVEAVAPIQINARWRILVAATGPSRRPAWYLQEIVGDVWTDRFIVRNSEMLRGLVKRHAGRVSPGVNATLAALPARVDLPDAGPGLIRRTRDW